MGSLASGATNSLVAKIGTKDSATWDHLQVAPQTPWWPKLELKIRLHLAESIEKITQLFQVEFSFQKRHLNHTTIWNSPNLPPLTSPNLPPLTSPNLYLLTSPNLPPLSL